MKPATKPRLMKEWPKSSSDATMEGLTRKAAKAAFHSNSKLYRNFTSSHKLGQRMWRNPSKYPFLLTKNTIKVPSPSNQSVSTCILAPIASTFC